MDFTDSNESQCTGEIQDGKTVRRPMHAGSIRAPPSVGAQRARTRISKETNPPVTQEFLPCSFGLRDAPLEFDLQDRQNRNPASHHAADEAPMLSAPEILHALLTWLNTFFQRSSRGRHSAVITCVLHRDRHEQCSFGVARGI